MRKEKNIQSAEIELDDLGTLISGKCQPVRMANVSGGVIAKVSPGAHCDLCPFNKKCSASAAKPAK